jgi:hypothetical protein
MMMMLATRRGRQRGRCSPSPFLFIIAGTRADLLLRADRQQSYSSGSVQWYRPGVVRPRTRRTGREREQGLPAAAGLTIIGGGGIVVVVVGGGGAPDHRHHHDRKRGGAAHPNPTRQTRERRFRLPTYDDERRPTGTQGSYGSGERLGWGRRRRRQRRRPRPRVSRTCSGPGRSRRSTSGGPCNGRQVATKTKTVAAGGQKGHRAGRREDGRPIGAGRRIAVAPSWARSLHVPSMHGCRTFGNYLATLEGCCT